MRSRPRRFWARCWSTRFLVRCWSTRLWAWSWPAGLWMRSWPTRLWARSRVVSWSFSRLGSSVSSSPRSRFRPGALSPASWVSPWRWALDNDYTIRIDRTGIEPRWDDNCWSSSLSVVISLHISIFGGAKDVRGTSHYRYDFVHLSLNVNNVIGCRCNKRTSNRIPLSFLHVLEAGKGRRIDPDQAGIECLISRCS